MSSDYLDFRRWPSIASCLAGIGIELAYALCLAGFVALFLSGIRILGG